MTHNGHVNEDGSSIQPPHQYVMLLNVILAKTHQKYLKCCVTALLTRCFVTLMLG